MQMVWLFFCVPLASRWGSVPNNRVQRSVPTATVASRVETPVLNRVQRSVPIATVDVAIIGGGPCGLATAIALSKAPALRGATVRVFERDSLEPKGAAIGLSPLAWVALEAIDTTLARQIRRYGSAVTAVQTRHLNGGGAPPAPVEPMLTPTRRAIWPLAAIARVVPSLGRRLFRALGLGPRVQTTFLWHDVREAMARRARELCGPDAIVSGCELVGMDADLIGGRDHMDCTFRTADGEHTLVRARLVLACDGVRSAARDMAPGGARAASVLRDEGKSVWRGIAPRVHVHGTATFFRDPSGGSRIAVLFPAGRGRGASWTVTADAVPGRARDAADAAARLQAALLAPGPDGAVASALDEQLAAALADSACVTEHRLVTREWEAPWPSGVDRLAFLGDAAHPLRPTGEGLALALEDAWLCGKLAADAPSADAFLAPESLRAYERQRLDRVRAISDAVNAQARGAYDAKGEATAGRPMLTVSEAVAKHPLQGFGPL
jgi:salicylate hydroxylase